MTEFPAIYSGAYARPAIEQEPWRDSPYRYFVTNPVTDAIIAEIPLVGVTHSMRVNSVGELSGTIPSVAGVPGLDSYWGTMPGRTGLYAVRGTDVVWGGIIWDRSYSITEGSLSIHAETWESYLYRRHIWRDFEGKSRKEPEGEGDDVSDDQYMIVKNLLTRLNHDFKSADPAEWGVETVFYEYPDGEPGGVAHLDVRAEKDKLSGVEMEEQWYYGDELKTFGEAITEMANKENGFEWNFFYHWLSSDPDFPTGRFARYIKFRDTPPHLLPPDAEMPTNDEAHKPGIDTWIFEYPGNIVEATLEEDASQACTRQFVVGGHEEDSEYKPRGVWNNPEYTAHDSGWPLLENIESSKHATEPDIPRLKRLARIYGRRSAPPLRSFSITVNGSMNPVVGSYWIGDWCRVVIDDPFVKQSLSQQASASNKKYANGLIKRIMGWTVSVPDAPGEPETVTLDLEDDWAVESSG